MELQTNNLISFTLQENVLQNNFQIIGEWFNSLKKDMHQCRIEQQMFTKQIHGLLKFKEQNCQKIEEIQNNIENMKNSQIRNNNYMNEFSKEMQKIKSHNFLSDFNDCDFEEHEVQMTENVGKQKIPLEQKQQVLPELKNERDGPLRKNMNKSFVEKCNDMKDEVEKIVAQLKRRVLDLEEDSLQKQEFLDKISVQVYGIKAAQEQKIHRRLQDKNDKPQQIKKKVQNSEQTTKKALKNLEKQVFQPEAHSSVKTVSHEEKQQSINVSKDRSSEHQIQQSKKGMKSHDEAIAFLMKQFQTLKQKTKSLDGNIYEINIKIQNIDKNMDLLQRSHEYLKFDYERSTSSNFSKLKTPATKDQPRRGGDILNETRITNREYYEDKLVELFNEMDFLKSEYFHILNKVQHQEKDSINQNTDQKSLEERKRRVAEKLQINKNFDQKDKRQIISCKKDLKKLREEFDELIFGVNTGKNEIKTYIIKPNETKQDWKSLSTKMYKMKMQLQGNIKELQNKIVTNNDMSVALNQLEVGIEETRLLLKKKIDVVESEKTSKRIQGRLNNFIAQVFEKEGLSNQYDALIAKQPWFCLSCDNELKNYTGKLNKNNISTDKLVGKKVNPESHMVRRNQRNQNGKLPSVIK